MRRQIALRAFLFSVLLIALLSMLVGDAPPPGDFDTHLASLVAGERFDFVAWTVQALGLKVSEAVAAEPNYLPASEQKQIVLDTFNLLDRALELEQQIDHLFADPSQPDPHAATRQLSDQLVQVRAQLADLQPLAEEVLQEQIGIVLSAEGFAPLGQVVPPVSFHITELPGLLIVSPRDRIERKAAISLRPGLSDAAEAERIEARVAEALDVSTLVVPLGGLATFPTMIYETRNLNFVAEVGAHEWTHNYLTLRPLGATYASSPELFTMNETTANLVGKEIGDRVIERFYPERYVPPAPKPTPGPSAEPTPARDPAAFDFRAEMRATRVRVDELLAAGEVEAAEAYMEEQRKVFVAHGYVDLRKLNQAYFAFHGSYADQPGAAGADPVGPAVVELRERSASLREFLETIAWLTSFEDLQEVLAAQTAHTDS